jgi:hypothetical protein
MSPHDAARHGAAVTLANATIDSNGVTPGVPGGLYGGGRIGGGEFGVALGAGIYNDAASVSAGNLLDVDPALLVLATGGGATETHALAAGSPAVDASRPPAEGGCRDADRVSLRGVLHAQIVADRADDHFAGVEPHAGAEAQPAGAAQLLALATQRSAQMERREAGALRGSGTVGQLPLAPHCAAAGLHSARADGEAGGPCRARARKARRLIWAGLVQGSRCARPLDGKRKPHNGNPALARALQSPRSTTREANS